jgi:hypothetical protein
MEDKLVKLFLKFIDKTLSKEDLIVRNRQITCVYRENKTEYKIIIKPYSDKINTESVYKIFFKDLIAETNHDVYSKIFNKAEDKIEQFEKAEQEKRLNDQIKLVDRLLDNI